MPTQAGTPVAVSLVGNDGGRFALVQVVPDKGEVELFVE